MAQGKSILLHKTCEPLPSYFIAEMALIVSGPGPPHFGEGGWDRGALYGRGAGGGQRLVAGAGPGGKGLGGIYFHITLKLTCHQIGALIYKVVVCKNSAEAKRESGRGLLVSNRSPEISENARVKNSTVSNRTSVDSCKLNIASYSYKYSI